MKNLAKRDLIALELLNEKGNLSLFSTTRISINSKNNRKSIEIDLFEHFENLEKIGLAKINYNASRVFSIN